METALDPNAWSLHPFTRSWCGWTDGQVNTGTNKDCPALQRQTLAELKKFHVDLLILSQDGVALTKDMASALRRFTGVAKHVVVLGRTPYEANFASCLHGDADISACQSIVPPGTWDTLQPQRSVAARFNATFIDTTPWFCFQARQCPPTIDGAPVFIDGNHLTAELAPKLGPLLRQALRAAGIP
jgi:hypothetical protein